MAKPKKATIYADVKGLAAMYLQECKSRKGRDEVVKQAIDRRPRAKPIMVALVYRELLKGDGWVANQFLADCVDAIAE